MSDPKQPVYVPVWAGDRNPDGTDTYNAPGEPYDGILCLTVPGTGTYSRGLNPDVDWLGAQSLNGLFQNYSMHIEAMADFPTFQTIHPNADKPGSTTDYCTTAGDTHPNVNSTSDYPLLHVTDKFLLSQLGHKSGSVGSGFVRRWRQSSHTDNSFDADQALINPTTANNPFTDGTSAGDTAAGDGNNPAVIAADPVSGYVLSLGATRSVAYSTDYGVTWTSGTALTTNANWHYPLVACAIGSQWLVVDQIDSAFTVNRVLVSNDLTAASWTVQGSSIGGTNTGYIRRITHNASIAVLLPDVNTNFGYWRPGDTSVTPFRLGGILTDGSRTGWRGAWNAQIGRFLIGNVQGDLWMSSDGINWAQIATNEPLLSVKDIVAHGRGFVISNVASSYSVDFLDFDRKFNYRIRRLYKATNQAVASAFHLATFGGRWYAGRVTLVVLGGPTDSYRMEWVYSARHPWDANNTVGR